MEKVNLKIRFRIFRSDSRARNLEYVGNRSELAEMRDTYIRTSVNRVIN